MKICSRCKEEKKFEDFSKDRQRKDGLCHRCKNCSKEYQRKYQKKNIEKLKQQRKEYYEENNGQIKECNKEYYKKNKEQIKESVKKYRKENEKQIKQLKKEYYEKNREKINKQKNEYFKERRKNDPQFRMMCSLRSMANRGIITRGGIKSAPTEKLLGCSFEEANLHIENQFLPGMTWENYGEWEIDHIRPIASFDLISPEQQRQCFHYTNLRPLWSEENLSKSSWWNGIKHDKRNLNNNF